MRLTLRFALAVVALAIPSFACADPQGAGPEPVFPEAPPAKSAEPSKPAPDDPAPTDKTSKTCQPTVPMLQAIPCEKYPAKLQSFCYKYKPLQMNMEECQAAERYAENAPPEGPKREECEKQTFIKGTSSWSYVLACAKVQANQGEKGDGSKITGSTGSTSGDVTAGNDPECVNRLKGRGVEFENLGRVNKSSGGRECVIQQAVQYSGKAINLGGKLLMDCTLAEKVEDFGERIKGMGVDRVTNLGSFQMCRGINNAFVTNGGKTSLHSKGYAIDINGYFINGRLVKTSDWKTDAGAKAQLEAIKQVGCQVFMGVLAFNFYMGKYLHTHYQVNERTRCDPFPRGGGG